MTDLASVVKAWRRADPKHIHPTREYVSEQAYWESGKPQAELVLDLVGVGAAVLDFGCGDGRIAIPMAKLGLQVVAVDAAPEMIERLDHQLQATNTDGVMSFVWDGVSEQPADITVIGAPFDAINARAVFIHHAHADIERIVPNLAALLKPGGFFICDWPVGGHHERVDWIDVTTWTEEHRANVATAASLELVQEGEPRVRPSIWRKHGTDCKVWWKGYCTCGAR